MSLTQGYNAGNRGSNYAWQKAMLLSQAQLMLQGGAYIKEVPAGAVDGVNRVFTIQHTPVSGSEMLFVSGALLADGGVDYTLVGQTFTLVNPPGAGQPIFVFYKPQ